MQQLIYGYRPHSPFPKYSYGQSLRYALPRTFGILLLTCLLAACATKTVNHLPKQAIADMSQQVLQMQYMTLDITYVDSSENTSAQKGSAQKTTDKDTTTLRLKVRTQIRTENIPTWVTQIGTATLAIYLVDTKNTVIATYKATIPPQDMTKVKQRTLIMQIPLPTTINPEEHSLAFGYHLPVSNAKKTRRIVLTEMAMEQ